MKKCTLLLTQEFNSTLKKEIEYSASALSEAETLKVIMAEMEKTMVLMTQKLTEPGTGNGSQGPLDLPAASWTTS